MKKVMLIDYTDEGPELAEQLRRAEGVTVEQYEQICFDHAALASIGARQPGTRCEITLDDAGVVLPLDAAGWDVVFLHVTNDCAKDYFEKHLQGITTVLYSGESGQYWDANIQASDHVGKADRSEVRNFGVDFVYELRPGQAPPREAMKGRSAKCKAFEQEFANKLKNPNT